MNLSFDVRFVSFVTVRTLPFDHGHNRQRGVKFRPTILTGLFGSGKGELRGASGPGSESLRYFLIHRPQPSRQQGGVFPLGCLINVHIKH